MEENAIVVSNEAALVPAMHYMDAMQAYQAMKEFVSKILKEGTDFGVIPGTEKKDGKDKKTLFKPGAEKLARFFGLSARFDITKEIEQWDDGNTFFYYRHKCTLSRISDGVVIAEGEGSCNSHEKRYRWRTAERVCPSCGQATIIKGKEEYGGGWLCWKKNGGCGAKFATGNQDIESQESGKVENPDIADVANTVLKQSKKRSFIDGVLLASNASEYFTQDIEDLDFGVVVSRAVDTTTGEIVEGTATTQAQPENGDSRHQGTPEAHWTETQNWKKFYVYASGLNLKRDEVHEALEVESAKLFTGTKAEAMHRLQEYAAAKAEALREEQAESIMDPVEFDKDEGTQAEQTTLDEHFGPRDQRSEAYRQQVGI